jgi:hypothetical protein
MQEKNLKFLGPSELLSVYTLGAILESVITNAMVSIW